MRTATALTVVLAGLVVLDAPAGDNKPIMPVEAIKKVNEEVTVQMLVKGAKNRLEKRGEIYLDSEENFKDEKNLGVVITKTGAAKFKEAGVVDPAVHFQDKVFRVKGTVIIKEERPRIEVDDPKDIQIINQEVTKTFTYSKTKQSELEIVVHFPPGWKETDKRPGIVFFFGGGWENGTIKAFEPQAQYLASRGMVTARADYRVKSRHGVTPKECVEDAKNAVRWFRQNAAKLGVDPDRIVASGGSAGGHIAACTTLKPGEEPEDKTVSSKANALILFNPVLRFGPQMLKRIDNDEAVGKAISPVLHLAKDSPPTLLFFGTDDFLFKQGEEFIHRSKELGHKAEMFTAERQPHGFFNKSPWREKTPQRTDEFLVSLGYLQGKLSIKIPDAKDDQPKPQPEAKVPPKPFTNSIGMKFVWIPPGSFMMGSPKEEEERHEDEIQHKVTLTKGYYMGVYTVTKEQWKAVMGKTPSPSKGKVNLPVETVSWEDCEEFVKKLREKDKKSYRLPTEAEWEYACRAGTTTPFHFGETISTDQATFGKFKKGESPLATTPVGSFPANAWGLYDMHGNVWQWCQDWFGAYPQKGVVDPQGPENGGERVLRGGSFTDHPQHLRSAKRHKYEPGGRDHVVGFRLCFFVE